MEVVDGGVRRFAANWRYCGVLRAFGEIIDGGGHHGWEGGIKK